MAASVEHIKVFLTYPHECGYLPSREASTLFIDPNTDIDTSIYSELSRRGFRRSGSNYYRPRCIGCNACVSCRVVAADFSPSRRHRRTLQRNRDLNVRILDNIDSDNCYELYADYINQRHRDGEMFPPRRDQYDSFLGARHESTLYLGFYANDALLAIAVTDQLDDGLSAMYTFYDPQQSRRSLGSYAILWQIEYTASVLRLPYVYLGYWISGCKKMDYKQQYVPLECLRSGRWQLANTPS